MKKTLLPLLFCLATLVTWGQPPTPIRWSFSVNKLSDREQELLFTATPDKGWHLYGMHLPDGGPLPTSFAITSLTGAERKGAIEARGTLIKKHDSQFDMELNWYDRPVTFAQKIVLTATTFTATGEVRFMGCNDVSCLPPSTEPFTLTGTGTGGLAEAPKLQSEPSPQVQDTLPSPSLASQQIQLDENPFWSPVIDTLSALGGESPVNSRSLWFIFLAGFGGGLLALFTPCVWPLIPMTVSFFLKRNKSRRKSITDAALYGLSIIVIYVALGIVITALFGAAALNSLATNAIFNLLFFALLVLFALSFFGAFDLTLPASWSTKMDGKADSTTGIISIFFMSFTLALVSFSCTGPIIGTLLVESAAMGVAIAPAIGMSGFALALAIPFSLFAIFPTWLKSMPKSGGWLNSVKVVLGFLELALALKFLSVADLAYGWHILDREVFVSLWIVLFALLGLYLLGKITFAHDSAVAHLSPLRLFLSIASFSFALYMVPGLWGAPLKAISAFTPPLSTQSFNLADTEAKAAFTDYDQGMEYARKHNKKVLLDFSGYGCVNCRKMEATVFVDPEVKAMIEKEYVFIMLMVDDKQPLPQPINITEYGKQRVLRTVGDKWSYLQRYKFGTNAQPYYVLLNQSGEPLAPAYTFNESIPDFLQFLQSGR